jgi:uncharacterized membrane protein (DUF373 family)
MIKTDLFERIVIFAITILLMAIIAISTLWLFFLVAMNAWQKLGDVRNMLQLQESVQQGIGGVFVVLLGLELLETLKTYVKHHRFRLEVVLVVGAIAVARHIIQLDIGHTDGGFLAGLGVLIASLVCGYYLLQKIPESRGGNLVESPPPPPGFANQPR